MAGGVIFQQDNAPAHASRGAQRYLNTVFPNVMKWPSKSPDLSPIEQVWRYIKKRLAGRQFATEEALFEAISWEWNNVPIEKLHNFYSSFKARCQTCLDINVKSLNGHWGEVKQYHNMYRTRLVQIVDQFGFNRLIEVRE